MGRTTRRPTTVTFAALVAGFLGAWSLLWRGIDGYIAIAEQAPLALAVVVVVAGLDLARLFLAAFLMQLYSWARPVGIVLLGFYALVNIWLIVTSGGGSIIGFVANSGAVAALLMSGDAFRQDAERADVSEEPATKIGTGSR